MKKQSNFAFKTLNREEVARLTNFVEENIAAGFNHAASRLFTTADLWNIQRQGKRRVQRRIFA